ncbi:FRG domain-containing protein [Halosolutus gelatinilyticus]|uniref:FRG domain-containing protein n=1 Tax=Halosolutus gelatinilyticus TaxID=2931975 RepID=UPI001FF6088C|nr:FRG domain-containing protein [Halosolutus gelatinilyticus]
MTADDPPIVRAETWADLQQLVTAEMWMPDLSRHRSPYVFRGVPHVDHSLETSINRFVGESGDWKLESLLLRNFLQYALNEIEEPDSVWHLLSIAEHYGLPTRLLDWSFSPLVATYFAVRSGDTDHDGAVWAVDYRKLHDQLPDRYERVLGTTGTHMLDVHLLSTVTREADRRRTATREAPAGNPDDVTRLNEFWREWWGVDDDEEPDDQFVMFFRPPAIDDRIANQSAVFSFQSDPRVPLDRWLEDRPDCYRKIVIPGDRKLEFRDKLDQMGVNHRTLFPGLEGLTTWLKQYYEPRE